MKLENLVLQPNGGKGYTLIIEGVPSYNTNPEGNQLHVEVISNRADFALEESQQVEPFEYVDKYTPSKYGIVFKEKLFVGPDHTSAAFNIRLRRNGQDMSEKRLFKVEILDQSKVIYSQEGFNQITIGHFMFRSNASLPDYNPESADDSEMKH